MSLDISMVTGIPPPFPCGFTGKMYRLTVCHVVQTAYTDTQELRRYDSLFSAKPDRTTVMFGNKNAGFFFRKLPRQWMAAKVMHHCSVCYTDTRTHTHTFSHFWLCVELLPLTLTIPTNSLTNSTLSMILTSTHPRPAVISTCGAQKMVPFCRH